MSSFDTEGFLSDDISEFEASISTRYLDKLNLAREANRLAHHVIYSAKIHNQHLPDLLLASLLTTQAASFQAFLILLQKGLLTQAQILLRNVAETMFITGAIGKDDTFAGRFVLAEDRSRKKSLEALVRDNECRGVRVEPDTVKLIAELEDKIDTERITPFSTERIAQIAELTSYYDTLYRLTSMAVHTSPRELDKTLQSDSEENIVSINYEPVVEGLEMYLDYGVSMMLYTLHEIASHFSLPVDGIENLQQRNKELAGPVS